MKRSKSAVREANDLPIYYKITTFLMKHNMNVSHIINI